LAKCRIQAPIIHHIIDELHIFLIKYRNQEILSKKSIQIELF